ncbi:MAG: hypothetical protein V4726_05645 [Verrucomicrobiota bacterium]
MARLVRIECEQRARTGGNLIDQRTGVPAFLHRGEDTIFELGLFQNRRMLGRADVSTMTVKFFNAANALIMTKNISNLDMAASITAAQWRTGAAALVRLLVIGSGTGGLPAGFFTLEVWANQNGQDSIFASGLVEAVTIPTLSTAVFSPPAPPGYWNKEEADGRFDFKGAAGTDLENKADKESPVFTGPVNLSGQLIGVPGGAGSVDSRVRFLSRSPVANGFNAHILKTDGDVADLNMTGMAQAHHSHTYFSTPGYAGVSQFYALAGGNGAALGCNTFTGLNLEIPYAIPGDPEANGSVRIEVGPSWPKSEAMRWNNGGDGLFGFRQVIQFTASQTGYIVTAAGDPFLPACEGNYLAWSTGAGGGQSAVDRILEYLTPSTVRVERTRTIASQPIRYGTYATETTPGGTLRQTGPLNQIVMDAHSGADNGAHRRRDCVRGIVTPDDTPAILYGPAVTGDYLQLWEVAVCALCANGSDYAIMRRTVQVVRYGGTHQIGDPVTPATDIVVGPAVFEVALDFAAGQLQVIVTGPGDVATSWTAGFACKAETVIV